MTGLTDRKAGADVQLASDPWQQICSRRTVVRKGSAFSAIADQPPVKLSSSPNLSSNRQNQDSTALTPSKRFLETSLLAAALSMMPAVLSGAAETAIKLGNTAPYSGPASAYGTIARAEAAYFQMLNDQGGINGRRVEFLTLDDAYSPAKTVEQTRKLVEQDEVLAMFSSVGTAPNISVQKYLNARRVPQIFVSSGATRWNDPEHFPWTVGFNPTYELEGRLYAEYILQTRPNAKIAVIAPNEDAGKDYVRGFKAGLGEHIDQLVSETTYSLRRPRRNSQLKPSRRRRAWDGSR
jgi:branched-chain amino acid transport system substrate-binding protein